MSLLQALKLTSSADPGIAVGDHRESGRIGQAGRSAPKTGQASPRPPTRGGRPTARPTERITALKAAVKSHCADAPTALVQEIEKGLVKLDEVMGDRRSPSGGLAGEGRRRGDDGARKAELATAKSIFTEYINYVTGAPLVAHIDQNPFGVKTDLRACSAPD